MKKLDQKMKEKLQEVLDNLMESDSIVSHGNFQVEELDGERELSKVTVEIKTKEGEYKLLTMCMKLGEED